MHRELDERGRGTSSLAVEYLLGGIGTMVILALAISIYRAIAG